MPARGLTGPRCKGRHSDELRLSRPRQYVEVTRSIAKISLTCGVRKFDSLREAVFVDQPAEAILTLDPVLPGRSRQPGRWPPRVGRVGCANSIAAANDLIPELRTCGLRVLHGGRGSRMRSFGRSGEQGLDGFN
jgi:hypothetical protein